MLLHVITDRTLELDISSVTERSGTLAIVAIYWPVEFIPSVMKFLFGNELVSLVNRLIYVPWENSITHASIEKLCARTN